MEGLFAILIGWIFLLIRGIMLQSGERTKTQKNIGIAMIIAFFAIPLIGFSLCTSGFFSLGRMN